MKNDSSKNREAMLYVVGIGPGSIDHLTPAAVSAIEKSSAVVGYAPYLEMISDLIKGKEAISTGMMKEEERCIKALQLASDGVVTTIVSSGDSGIYGMAGLVLELASELSCHPEIEIIPGISAVNAAASVLGAPLMHDFAVISLSDLMTEWSLIEKRLESASMADFVIALYNPKSTKRTWQIEKARSIILQHRKAETPVGIVRNALRNDCSKIVTTLSQMTEQPIDMFSIVIIGNTATYSDFSDRIITPRGYKNRKEQQIQSRYNPRYKAKALMFCGTGSDVGKSIISAGFCRMLANRGVSVAPFKSQNMALNSAVTAQGGEIGRAQAVQAEACRIDPHTDMNPVLLKPSSDHKSQVIVQGVATKTMDFREYTTLKPEIFKKVEASYARLAAKYDVIVLEGAGGIAEINLKETDIANLKVAEMANASVILVAEIERGGVFAQLVGTWELLEPDERERVKGFIINRFRGDVSLLDSGIKYVEKRTGRPVFGVIPWLENISIAAEDSLSLKNRKTDNNSEKCCKITIGIVKLPRMSNFTDFDPLEKEPDILIRYVESPEDLFMLDALIIPGSKATTSDMYFLMERGLYDAIREFKGSIAGICGGYQMLGRTISDPQKLDSDIIEAQGLNLLDVETVMLPQKNTHLVKGRLEGGRKFFDCDSLLNGYEIHLGKTTPGKKVAPFSTIVERSGQSLELSDGAISEDGRIFGTYMHGIFDNHDFRTAWLNSIRYRKGIELKHRHINADDPLDRLAKHLESHLDVDKILSFI